MKRDIENLNVEIKVQKGFNTFEDAGELSCYNLYFLNQRSNL